jgi:hypothetical protein
LPISRIEVNEYQCALCGYKWINRVNGKDGPIPKRCAKCKDQRWEKGKINSRETVYRDRIKKRFRWYQYLGFLNGWHTEGNAMRYLASRPSIKEMKVLLNPMCYLFTWRNRNSRKSEGCVLKHDSEYIDEEATKKAHEYEKQLSRQLLKELMTQRRIPYDEKDAKMLSLYLRHGKYSSLMLFMVTRLCNDLKKEQPDWSNEDIKAKVLKEVLEEWSKEPSYTTAFPEELIQSCWPDWLK